MIALECDEIAERRGRFGIDEARFAGDAAWADMLLMPLLRISELSAHVDSEALRGAMPLSAWWQVRGLRGVIACGHGSTDRAWAWATVERGIPALRGAILGITGVREAYEHETALMARKAKRPERGPRPDPKLPSGNHASVRGGGTEAAGNKKSVYPRPLSAAEAADWLGISQRSVLHFARDGILPGVKVGHQWRFSQEALAEYAGVKQESNDGRKGKARRGSGRVTG